MSVSAVKERELPKADDEFAQMASEFDTIAEFRESLKGEITRRKGFDVGREARGKLIDVLIEKTEIPLPEGIVEDEVHRHLEGEGRLEDDKHRAEVLEQSTESFKVQMLLDAIAEKEELVTKHRPADGKTVAIAGRMRGDQISFTAGGAE